jgi:hypothetical protein
MSFFAPGPELWPQDAFHKKTLSNSNKMPVKPATLGLSILAIEIAKAESKM